MMDISAIGPKKLKTNCIASYANFAGSSKLKYPSEHVYNVIYLPGTISSVTAAPPKTCLFSSTTTFFPALARYAACGWESQKPTD